MQVKINVSDNGAVLEVIKDGSVVVNRNSSIDIYVEDLRYEIAFETPVDGKPAVSAETVECDCENAPSKDKYMRIILRVDKNELSSLFCSPVIVGTLTNNATKETEKLYFSFNARSLDGGSSNCIMFNYSILVSK